MSNIVFYLKHKEYMEASKMAARESLEPKDWYKGLGIKAIAEFKATHATYF